MSTITSYISGYTLSKCDTCKRVNGWTFHETDFDITLTKNEQFRTFVSHIKKVRADFDADVDRLGLCKCNDKKGA